MMQENHFPTSSQWNTHAGLEGKFLQIGVAESKDILSDFSLKSYSGGYKILILWMPEALHTSASNKLLKFIEEPEPGSLILLVSHNSEKVLGTILSRTQQTRIPKLTFEELADHLIHVENKSQSEAEIAALASNGNIREALDILENPERELGFAADFVQWMRFAVMANLPELVKFSEAMAKKNKDAARDFLKFSLRIIDHCLQLRYINKPTGDAIFEPAGFKIEKFAPYIKPANADVFYKEMNSAIYEMERNVNPKFIWLDMSVELSKALRIK
jgi:DNA polymerase-3 subunit delta'